MTYIKRFAVAVLVLLSLILGIPALLLSFAAEKLGDIADEMD